MGSPGMRTALSLFDFKETTDLTHDLVHSFVRIHVVAALGSGSGPLWVPLLHVEME